MNTGWILPFLRTALVLLFMMSSNSSLFAYSVLTHEEIIDIAWLNQIRPLLLARYPNLTPDQIKEAHAYAYGGSVIQDLGYYPFGSKEFSDLTHYVRSGDFVLELIHQSQNANEYAFALGALSHYTADINGHPAVNESVALRYPKLRAKYGRSVRYAQDKTAHIKTEFGFDTLQVFKNRYASEQYHDFIGFKVALPLLERSFPIIYGLPLKDVLAHEDLAVGSYRYSVSRLIPQMTQVALAAHKKDLLREKPDFARRKFLYHLSRSDYEREWGKTYTKPGFGTRFLAVIIRIMPKIGPFKSLGFDNPTPQTEDLYIKSIDLTVARYGGLLKDEGAGKLLLPNCDLDTGNETQAAEYTLTDTTYADLLAQLSAHKFDQATPELRNNILGFYSDLALPIAGKNDGVQWQSVLDHLSELKAFTPTPHPVNKAAPIANSKPATK